MFEIYMFSRVMVHREPINVYGKMGWRRHKEAVFIQADSYEAAERKLAPFNYKKHIKFVYEGTVLVDHPLNEIVDLGLVEEQ